MRCAVFNCDNNNNKNNESSIRFYCFPKDKALRKQWVHFCRRKDQFNVKTSRICCAHFAPDDIGRNLQFEMGLCQKNGYKLKPGTIPTLDSKAEIVSLSSRSNQMQARATQEMIACLIQQTPAPAEATETEEAEKEPTVAEGEDSTSNDFFVESYTETLKDRITSLENEVETLKRKNFILTENEKCFQQQVRSLEKLLQQSEFERGNMEDKLKKIFTAGQVNKLKNGFKRIQWSEADIAQSITLYSASAKAYKLLRRKNFPLPDLKNRFKLNYILTYRLNQDVLENFFGVIRTKGGLHDHPDSQEFKYRLRSYILGYNEGVLSDSANAAVDDTPDLEGMDYTLTGTILKSVTISPESIDVLQAEEKELESIAHDGLENLAGYICHKLRDKVPDIRVDPERDNTFTWENHLNEGGLSKPTADLMLHMSALEKVFDSVNGDDLLISKDFLKIHLELAENISCEEKIKKLFFRARMFFRIRKLNREIAENYHKRKRKFNKILY